MKKVLILVSVLFALSINWAATAQNIPSWARETKEQMTGIIPISLMTESTEVIRNS